MDDLAAWNKHSGVEVSLLIAYYHLPRGNCQLGNYSLLLQAAVIVIAATNEPWAIDEGFLRTGRLGRVLYVGTLDEEGRREYFLRWFLDKARLMRVKLVSTEGTDADMIHQQHQLSITPTIRGHMMLSTQDIADLLTLDRHCYSSTSIIATSSSSQQQQQQLCGEEVEEEEHCFPTTHFESIINRLVNSTAGYTGADCHLLMKKACMNCYKHNKRSTPTIHPTATNIHPHHHPSYVLPSEAQFMQAIEGLVPSVSAREEKEYKLWQGSVKI